MRDLSYVYIVTDAPIINSISSDSETFVAESEHDTDVFIRDPTTD